MKLPTLRSAVRIAALAIALFGAGLAAAGELPRVTERTSTDSVRVAEPFSFELMVSAPVGAEVSFPEGRQQIGEFEILDVTDHFDIPDAENGAQRTWTRRMTLESLVTGELQIPAVEIQVRDDNASQTLRSQPVSIRVVSVLEERGDPTQFRDIQSVVDVEVPEVTSNRWAWWALGGTVAGVALVGALAVVAFRRRQGITPKEWALAELEQSRASFDAGDMSGESLAFTLADVLRRFLWSEFSVSESGLTPEEVLQRIAFDNQLDEAIADRLRNLFELADKAKFAGYQLSSEDAQHAIAEAQQLLAQVAKAVAASSQGPKE